MLVCLPEIIVDDAALRATKRRRLDTLNATAESACEYESKLPTPPSTCATTGGLCDEDGVCYGMISDLTVNVTPSHRAASPDSTDYSIWFEPPRKLHLGHPDVPIGQLDKYGGELLDRLVADDELILQFLLSSTPIAVTADLKLLNNKLKYLGVIIYGPRRRSGDLGEFMTQAGCYLDDPVRCERNVPYLNPQCLFSLHEQLPMTFELMRPQQSHVENSTRAPLDILSGFETTDELELSPTPIALRTDLKTHQRQALTFLLKRERGMHPSVDGYGLWLRKMDRGRPTFVNALTEEIRSKPGRIWRGGLLADEMGLGKTLTMIALIASDHDQNSSNHPTECHSTFESSICSTLIVVPLSLFSVWELQLRSHVHYRKLTWFMHHGKSRFKLKDKDSPPDIVFTTYQTVERENRTSVRSCGTVFSYHWRRIILDEAHIIRNHSTSTAQAMAALRATSRWAISGTPIQNSLLDFHSLFKFLHFSPYDDPKVFDDHISNVWRTKPPDEAAEIFRKLLSCVMMRRTKAILDLPTRDDKIWRVPFNHEEKEYYRRIEQPVVDMLDRTTGRNGDNNVPWTTAIQQINKLRLVCNMGIFLPTACNMHAPKIPGESTSVMHARYLMGEEFCMQCFQPVGASTLTSELRNPTQPRVFHSACNHFYCADCAALLDYRSPVPCACMQPQPCQLRALVTALSTPRLTPAASLSPFSLECDQMDTISSKVWALVSQIRSRSTEKHLVFSSWTSSLDMVERALRYDPNNVIASVRIDGKVSPKNRSHAMQQLHENPNIRVILITIACGACGLDLTAASVVHLLEPQWNPSTEDQALARVHRLGQTRPVTTIRYVMEDSFEEYILKVQDRKKLLATTLLSNGSSLENLRQLLHDRHNDEGASWHST